MTEAVTSAMIGLGGALVGGILASAANLILQHREQRARAQLEQANREAERRTLVFTKAIELAIEQRRIVKEVAQETGAPANLQDPVVSAESYYRWLEHLYAHGEVHPDARRLEDESRRDLAAADETRREVERICREINTIGHKALVPFLGTSYDSTKRALLAIARSPQSQDWIRETLVSASRDPDPMIQQGAARLIAEMDSGSVRTLATSGGVGSNSGRWTTLGYQV